MGGVSGFGGGVGAQVFGGHPFAQLGGVTQAETWQQAQLNAHLQAQQMQMGLANAGAQAGGNWASNQTPYGGAALGAGAGFGAQGAVAYPGPQNACVAPRTIEDAGTSFGEFLGWRIWRVQSGFLVSFSVTHAWVPGEPMHGMPSDYGGDGVWAFKQKSRALFKMLETEGTTAMGSVRMWGSVVEHTDGYRAEYATIAEISMVRGLRGSRVFGRSDEKLLVELRRTYGV